MSRSETDAFPLSRIVYGLWRLADDRDVSPAHIQAKIETCLAHGITTLDQADIYGAYEAEALLGTCFKAAPHLRDKVEIVTKCGIVAPFGRYRDARVKHYDTSAEHIQKSVDHSLSAMHIDQIDVLLIHRPDPFMDAEETGGALDALVASGKVGHVGVSNFRPHDWSLLQAAMDTPLLTNQIELSLTTHAPFTNGDLAFLQERKVRPMAWSPLGGGALVAGGPTPLNQTLAATADRLATDPATLAIAWLLAHPAGICPVIGTNTLDRIAGLARAVDLKIDRETWFDLYSAALGDEVA